MFCRLPKYNEQQLEDNEDLANLRHAVQVEKLNMILIS